MVWPDGMPLVATPVDWFILAGAKRLLPWAEAIQIEAPFATQSPDLVTFNYDEALPEVLDILFKLPPQPRLFHGLPQDQVLDRGMVERAIAALPKELH